LAPDSQFDGLQFAEDPRRRVPSTNRCFVDFELAPQKVDDPVSRDVAGAIHTGQLAVFGNARSCYLDDQSDVAGPGVVIGVVIDRDPNDGDIRLRLTPAVGDANRLFLQGVPAQRKDTHDRMRGALNGNAVPRALYVLLHDAAFDQLETVRFRQDTPLQHLVV